MCVYLIENRAYAVEFILIIASRFVLPNTTSNTMRAFIFRYATKTNIIRFLRAPNFLIRSNAAHFFIFVPFFFIKFRKHLPHSRPPPISLSRCSFFLSHSIRAADSSLPYQYHSAMLAKIKPRSGSSNQINHMTHLNGAETTKESLRSIFVGHIFTPNLTVSKSN